MEEVTILSYGAGQDSQTILLKLLHDPVWREQYVRGELLVVMADTTNEHRHTLRTIARTRMYLASLGVPFYLVGEQHRTDSWKGGLTYQWERGVPSIGSKAYPKTCTDNLKVQPIYKFLAELFEHHGYGPAALKKSLYGYKARHGKLRVLIGIAAGEESRRADPAKAPRLWQRDCVAIEYPLLDHGLARSDCQSYLKSMEEVTGIETPYPSNCMFCPFNQEFDLVWLSRNEPSALAYWIELEARKLQADIDTRLITSDRSLGVWGKAGKPLPVILAGALEKYGHMTDEELNTHKFSHGHCVSSAY